MIWVGWGTSNVVLASHFLGLFLGWRQNPRLCFRIYTIGHKVIGLIEKLTKLRASSHPCNRSIPMTQYHQAQSRPYKRWLPDFWMRLNVRKFSTKFLWLVRSRDFRPHRPHLSIKCDDREQLTYLLVRIDPWAAITALETTFSEEINSILFDDALLLCLIP